MRRTGTGSERSFSSRLWAALPLAMLGLAIAVGATRFTWKALVGLDCPHCTAGSGDVSAGCHVPNGPESRGVVGLWMLVVVIVLLRRTRGAVGSPGGGAAASIARGFGYGVACMCFVSAALGAWEGCVTTVPWWVFVMAVLACALVVYGRRIEITGNSPLDAVLAAALIIGLAHVVASGALCAIQWGYLSLRVFWAWVIGSLLIGLGLSVFHWAIGE